MSTYIETVRTHWETHRPRELAQMSDPETFIRTKAQEIQVAVLQAEQDLEETLDAEPDYQARVGQLKQIRATARDQVFRELLPPPESETSTATRTAGQQEPALDPRLAELLAIRDELSPVRLEDD
jgi:hypothetical protein